tara:strand:+ start:612 stop:953 length:342 start_codon:yes stop_codon:yes gene_type:complete
METFYLHNSRCSKSRKGLELLEEKGIKFKVIEYLKTPLTKVQLNELYDLLNKRYSINVFTRVKEKEFNNDIYKLDKSSWVEMIAKTPKLIERPILFNKKNAIIGRPPEELLSF